MKGLLWVFFSSSISTYNLIEQEVKISTEKCFCTYLTIIFFENRNGLSSFVLQVFQRNPI